MNDTALLNPSKHEQLIRSALPLLHSISHRMWRRLHYKLELEELLSVGLVTLHDAACRYDPSRGSFPGYLAKRLMWAMRSEARRGDMGDERGRGSPLGVAGRFLDHHPRQVKLSPNNEDESAVPSLFEYGAAGRALTCAAGDLSEVAMDAAAGPEAASMQRQAQGLLRQVVAKLPLRQRAILERHYYDGERFTELAADLGISRTRACRLHREALQHLARCLRHSGIRPGEL